MRAKFRRQYSRPLTCWAPSAMLPERCRAPGADYDVSVVEGMLPTLPSRRARVYGMPEPLRAAQATLLDICPVCIVRQQEASAAQYPKVSWLSFAFICQLCTCAIASSPPRIRFSNHRVSQEPALNDLSLVTFSFT